VVEGEEKRAGGSKKGPARAQERRKWPERTGEGMKKVVIPRKPLGDLFVG
jgi:hypothetical protein